MSVGHKSEPSKMDEPVKMPFGMPKQLWWEARSSAGIGIFGQCYDLVTKVLKLECTQVHLAKVSFLRLWCQDHRFGLETLVPRWQSRDLIAVLLIAWDCDLGILCDFKGVLPTEYTHLFNGPLSGTTQVSRYQKGQTNLDFTDARGSDWQWHQLGHMQLHLTADR